MTTAEKIDRYAVFGNPIKHSKSPVIHTEFAKQCNQSMLYRAVKVDVHGFSAAAKQFFESGGSGLNVTVPFKRDAYDFADNKSVRAQRAGAVNTLIYNSDGTISGDNTDGIGLVKDMIANLGWRVNGMRVLVLGAGGAVRGVLEPLLREHPKDLLVVNRTPERAVEIAAQFADLGPVEGGAYSLIGQRQFDLIINGTSGGLSGEMPDIPSSILTQRSCCYDMVYGAEPTVFMRWAAHHAAWAVADGLGMLVEQAAESFYLWRRARPESGPVISQVRASISPP
ncbi:MAG: shikimate dehydrogenase [Halioglobus sp.]|jgi:shikimate dehydrogenase